MVNSLLVLAIVVLPGWLSITANRVYHPRVLDTSPMMLWGMMFYHAAVVHAIGVGIVAVATLIQEEFFLDTLGLVRVLTEGPADFTKASPRTGFGVFGAYTLWLFFASIASGIVDAPSRLTKATGWLLRTARLAPEPLPEEPIWYGALNVDRTTTSKANVQLRARMKNGDVYVGSLHSYPILSDTAISKDFRLGDSVLYPGGDTSSPVEMYFSKLGGGGVLLNTANVSSIEYLYHDEYDSGSSTQSTME